MNPSSSGMIIPFRVTAPHFVAGGEIQDDKVIRAAPILKRMIRRSTHDLIMYCANKKWQVECEALAKERIEEGW
jgi:hypothetical protein